MTRPSAGRVRAMVRKEARQLLRDPRTRLVVFVAPVIQLLLFGYAVTTDLRDAATWVVDLDRTVESRRLVTGFETTGRFEVAGRSGRPADLSPGAGSRSRP